MKSAKKKQVHQTLLQWVSGNKVPSATTKIVYNSTNNLLCSAKKIRGQINFMINFTIVRITGWVLQRPTTRMLGILKTEEVGGNLSIFSVCGADMKKVWILPRPKFWFSKISTKMRHLQHTIFWKRLNDMQLYWWNFK